MLRSKDAFILHFARKPREIVAVAADTDYKIAVFLRMLHYFAKEIISQNHSIDNPDAKFKQLKIPERHPGLILFGEFFTYGVISFFFFIEINLTI